MTSAHGCSILVYGVESMASIRMKKEKIKGKIKRVKV
jgi:hypothetical protein